MLIAGLHGAAQMRRLHANACKAEADAEQQQHGRLATGTSRPCQPAAHLLAAALAALAGHLLPRLPLLLLLSRAGLPRVHACSHCALGPRGAQ